MSLGTQGIFNTAVQAMLSQSQFMSNISTNIANVNTTAYKAQDTHFATLLNHTSPGGGAGTSTGVKSFFSVNTYDSRNVEKQGTIATTNRTFDVALNGRGFFVTNDLQDGSAKWQYTRDGAFFGEAIQLETDTDNNGQNDQGTLLVTANGNYVYGWAADENGVIDEGSGLTPIMYNNNSLFAHKPTENISLQANLSAATAGRQRVGLPFVDATGVSRTLAVGFTPAGVGSFTIPEDSDRLDAGQTIETFNWTLDMNSVSTNMAETPASFTYNPDNGEPVVLQFDGKGNLLGPFNRQLAVTVHDEADQVITLDLRKLTQLADEGTLTVQNIQQDGHLQGRLDKTYFDGTGMLIGSYSNGEKRNLYKLGIARFTAENNLEAKPGNMFERTQAAGDLVISGINSSLDRTQLIVGALETSNVDLADQFSKMIITQRAYSSSATVLRTADEMTMAARDLKR